ncbi:flagellar export chaperone FliS [Paenibacillus mucilaginosus]|uniref:Flagellar secretion chaperone FliS n=3 Tax=Paenibacillus mucilaginosus TaxID=61624 RepID=H6NT81_9BACL|nr:flagellar export chaperone FliS [Paenibacillus mucilaginosus]AEI38764.1 flagellar protein FliS [Paenibacillus mucilaginosus KNP414]AFC27094.1 flagellar protein FliS [Paenibacillus mucilaginosus 3016]AFH59232.1 flagellar biosynthesis protein FliS [Paenibacillus mucilaginosus K02]MCG7215900.1 flagellar export chaperone FliS [Paenibacillus mucilaginosus]WDM27847.1 flagellar export chaperone FliS [Paenibacillus mucilaginosus]
MLQAQQNKYLSTSVQTASPAHLLMMLYDGAIRFCRAGIEAMKQNRYEEVNRNLVKAQDIVRELMVTLDPKQPISADLTRLYDYFIFRLVEANMKKQSEPAEEVLEYLVSLKETWIQASRAAAGGQAVGATHA